MNQTNRLGHTAFGGMRQAAFGGMLLLCMLIGSNTFGQELDTTGKRYAILVGINDYVDNAILSLSTARNDAVDLGRTLEEAGWDKVFVLRDDLDYRDQNFPNRTNIENSVYLLAELVDPDDTIFFFFSGHGVSTENGAQLLPVDASLNRLDGTSIPLQSIAEAFTSRGIRKVVVAVDACREQVSRTKGLSVVGVTPSDNLDSAALVLYATKSGWYSYEDENRKNGLFTRFLLEGLKGEADGFKPVHDETASTLDGVVTFSELAGWLPEASGAYALEKGLRQKAVVQHGAGNAEVLAVPVSVNHGFKTSAADTPTEATEFSSAHSIDRSEQDFDERRTKRVPPDLGPDKSGLFFFQIGLVGGLQLCPSWYTITGPAVGIISTSNKEVYSIQAAPFVSAEKIGGVQTGIFAKSDTVWGVQFGGISCRADTVYGGQFGLINTASEVHGIQFGLINRTHVLKGVQIGLLNSIQEGGLFGSFMLGCNIGF